MFVYIKVFKLFRFTNLDDIFYTLPCSSFSNISRILSNVNMNRFPLLHCSIVFHCHNLVNNSPIDRNFIFFYMNYATTNVLAQCKLFLQHKFLEMEILGQNVYIFKCWQILLNFLLKRLYQLKLLLPMYKRTCFLEPLLILGISILYFFCQFEKWHFGVVLIYISFIVGKAEHLSICLMAIYVLSFEGRTSTRNLQRANKTGFMTELW